MTIESPIPYWTPIPPADTPGRLRECLSVLGNRRQRSILRVLTDAGRSLSTAELGSHLPEVEDDIPVVTPPTETAVRTGLAHVDLPRLTVARFVATNREQSSVRLLDHSLLDDPHVERLLACEALSADLLALLAVGRHRLICAILAGQADPLPREHLASLFCAAESDSENHPLSTELSTASNSLHNEPSPAVEAMVEALHHVHLPALAAAGLVVYDPEAGTVTARAVSALDELWQPTAHPDTGSTHRSVESAVDGLTIRLVVTADGRVDEAYACSVTASTVGSVTIPTRRRQDIDYRGSGRSPTREAAAATEPGESGTGRQQQWLVDCWLRQQAGR